MKLLKSVSLLFTTAGVFSAGAWKVSEFAYEDLVTGLNGANLQDFVKALQTDGIIGVKSIPSWMENGGLVHSELPSCAENALVLGKASETPLVDGSSRITIALNKETDFSAEESNCSKEFGQSMFILRSALDNIGVLFAKQIMGSKIGADKLAFKNGVGEKRNLRELIEEGSHLDHFHVYNPSSEGSSAESIYGDLAMPLHTDKGLFLVLSPSKDQSLITEKGEVEIEDKNNSVFVLVGEAFNSWANFGSGGVAGLLSGGVQPCLHAVKRFDTQRVVFGRMFLPSKDTIIENADGSSGTDFYDYFFGVEDSHDNVFNSELEAREMAVDAIARWRRLSATQCAEGEVLCWMQCMKNDTCGSAGQQCWDYAANAECPIDKQHRKTCGAACKQSAAAIVVPSFLFFSTLMSLLFNH